MGCRRDRVHSGRRLGHDYRQHHSSDAVCPARGDRNHAAHRRDRDLRPHSVSHRRRRLGRLGQRAVPVTAQGRVRICLAQARGPEPVSGQPPSNQLLSGAYLAMDRDGRVGPRVPREPGVSGGVRAWEAVMRAWALAVAAGVVVWMAMPAGLPAKERADPLSEKIERERRMLEKLQQEIIENKKHADETEKKKESVLQAIQDLDGDLLQKRQERGAIGRRVKEKDREIDRINAQLTGVRVRIEDRRSSILARLRAQYMEGR